MPPASTGGSTGKGGVRLTEDTLPIKTHLVCGFLGAGKTTFILDQLKRAGSKAAVLVNEFGKLGIDGEMVRTRGEVDVVELPGGCVCCSQKEGLAASVRTIAEEIRPELLLIEPSGIAEASELLKVLAASAAAGLICLGAVITVIDAETFLEYSEPEAFGSFFLDQLENADIIIVNKSDLVGEVDLAAIDLRIGEINSEALALKAKYCRVDNMIPGERAKAGIISHANRLPFECLSVQPPDHIPSERLNQFLSQVTAGAFGRVLRTKGFVRIEEAGWLLVQGTGKRLTLEQTGWAVEPRLTLIGFGLDEARILEFFTAKG
jgi:G3E family GTPase